MPTAKEYRARAKECLEMANAAKDRYVRTALRELTLEFNREARQAERRERDMAAFSNLQTH